jgi:hypothetical protein
MSNVVRNFRHAIENGKARILLHSSPQFIQGREDWVDLEQEYADVKDIRMPQDVPTSLQTKYKEWRDIERHFHIPRLAEEIILDTDDISSINIHGRTEGIKQAESILVDKGKTHWVPTGQTELVEDPIAKELFEQEIYKEESLLEPLIQYPRELVWLDGAEDIPGVIILPYDDYDKVYVLEGTKENPTIRFIDDKATAGGVRPYYEKPGDGKTHIYVNGFSGGAGTQSDPYIITTADELQAINNNLSAHYALGCDIDCSDTVNWNDGAGFETIGGSIYNNKAFAGSVDGRNYHIINLKASQGFIYDLTGTIQNVYFINISAGHATSEWTSGVALSVRPTGVVRNCGIDGYIRTSDYTAASSCVIAGFATYNQGLIENSYSDCLLESFGSGMIADSGIAGFALHNYGTINHCYSTCRMISPKMPCMGFSKTNTGTIASCYWDEEISGVTTSAGGIGKTTTEMKQQSTYTGWDFENVWGIDPDINDGYPYLRGFSYGDEEPEPLAPGYHIERRVDGGSWESLVHLPLTKFGHIDDTAITVGSQYEYRIKKVFEWGDETDWSNISSLQLLAWLWRGRKTEFPSEQTINVLDVVRTFPTDFSIKYWGDVIERQTNGGSWEIIEVLQNLSGEYLDTTIQSGDTYSYRIKRERYTNTSDWSNISSIEVGTGVEEKEGSASLSSSGFVISLGEKQSKTFVVISTGEKVFAQGVALETTDGPVSISGAGLTVAQGNKQVLDVISVSTSGNIVIQGVIAESNQGSILLSAKGTTTALGTKRVRAPPTGVSGYSDISVIASKGAFGLSSITIGGSILAVGESFIPIKKVVLTAQQVGHIIRLTWGGE